MPMGTSGICREIPRPDASLQHKPLPLATSNPTPLFAQGFISLPLRKFTYLVRKTKYNDSFNQLLRNENYKEDLNAFILSDTQINRMIHPQL